MARLLSTLVAAGAVGLSVFAGAAPVQARLVVTHDVNARAISQKVHGFVQAQIWFQDVSPGSLGHRTNLRAS